MSEQRRDGDEGRGAARLLAGGRERVRVARAELALPERLRLTERDRIAVSAMLAALVRSVEDELRSALASVFAVPGREPLHAALTSASVAIAGPVLEAARDFPDAALLSLLLRRAEEHRMHRAAGGEHGLLLQLAGDRDEAIAGEAMAIRIVQSGRVDPFQEPRLAREELPAETMHGLVWTIAAALRRYMVREHRLPGGEADEAIAEAAAAFLAAYDEGRGPDPAALRLAKRLDAGGRLTDEMLERAAADGALPLLLAGLAVRTALDPRAAWEIVSDPQRRGPVLLLRAADVARDQAGSILLRLASRDPEAAAPLLDQFDTTDPGEARRLLRLWQLDPAYRAAVARLSEAA
jgi:hypothetical protein